MTTLLRHHHQIERPYEGFGTLLEVTPRNGPLDEYIDDEGGKGKERFGSKLGSLSSEIVPESFFFGSRPRWTMFRHTGELPFRQIYSPFPYPSHERDLVFLLVITINYSPKSPSRRRYDLDERPAIGDSRWTIDIHIPMAVLRHLR